MHDGPWLKDLLVFLVAAGLVVPLLQRARIGAVLAFLLIGIAVGPYGFGQFAAELPWVRFLTIEDRARAAPFAELGVMFLLFLIGIEMSAERLWSMRRYVLGIGGLQFVLSAVAIGLVLWLSGLGGKAAVILGLGLAMSSTAVVMQLLEEQGRTVTAIGRVAISVLLFQDLMVAPALFSAEVLARSSPNVALDLALAMLQAVATVTLIAVAGRYLLRPLFHFAVRSGSRELIMAVTLLLVIGVAAVTGQAGLSSALGAFLAGVLLSETEFRHHVEIDIAPFKGLLLGLFFITVGMTIDLGAVWHSVGLVLGSVVALLLLKAAVLFAVCRLLGVRLGVATETGILLAQAGEFGFILIGLVGASGALPAGVAAVATAAVGLSMMVTPLLGQLARAAADRIEPFEHRDHTPPDLSHLTDHVIIGGYGRVGQTVARLLELENVRYVALDASAELVLALRAADAPIFFGDAGRRELLQRAGAAGARAFVVTVNDPRAAERMVHAAHAERPDAPVLSRARDAGHVMRLIELGATGVIPETVEASLQLGGRLLEALGVPDDAVAQRLAQMRERELERLTGDDAGGAVRPAS